MPFCNVKSSEMGVSDESFTALFGSPRYPTARIVTSYSPKGRPSIRYFPCGSLSTCMVRVVCAFRARTNAPLNGAPEGSFTLPAIAPPAACARDEKHSTSPTTTPTKIVPTLFISTSQSFPQILSLDVYFQPELNLARVVPGVADSPSTRQSRPGRGKQTGVHRAEIRVIQDVEDLRPK